MSPSDSSGASLSELCLRPQSEPLRRVSPVLSCSRLCEPHNDHSALLVVELLFISSNIAAVEHEAREDPPQTRRTKTQLDGESSAGAGRVNERVNMLSSSA